MAFGSKENKTPVQVPAHIGIIMDGNGRWAKKRGLPRTAGHTAGAQNFRTITRYASSIGVKYLTLYAFSTENWSRPAEEVSALMKLFHQYLEEALRDFMDENIRVRFIGDISAFAPDLQALIHRVEEASSVKTGMVLNLAMNYGGGEKREGRADQSQGLVLQRQKRRAFARGHHGGNAFRRYVHRRPA